VKTSGLRHVVPSDPPNDWIPEIVDHEPHLKGSYNTRIWLWTLSAGNPNAGALNLKNCRSTLTYISSSPRKHLGESLPPMRDLAPIQSVSATPDP
jgi:hypothetical protein